MVSTEFQTELVFDFNNKSIILIFMMHNKTNFESSHVFLFFSLCNCFSVKMMHPSQTISNNLLLN